MGNVAEVAKKAVEILQAIPEMRQCVGLGRRRPLGPKSNDSQFGKRGQPQVPLTMQERPMCHTPPVERVSLVGGCVCSKQRW